MSLGAAILMLASSQAALAPMPRGQASYTEGCGGCHGLLGVSAKRQVPPLRDRVGAFLCSREGRDYVVQLPNVAFASMDDKTLAGALNFMMFSLGGTSLPTAHAAFLKAYTADEVHKLRKAPLKARDVVRLRHIALSKADDLCLKNVASAGRTGSMFR